MQPVAATLSALDQHRFGVQTAKALCFDEGAVLSSVADAKALGARLLILRVPAAKWKCVATAQETGGLLTDVLDYYEWAACELASEGEAQRLAAKADLHVRTAIPSDAEEVGALAKAAFADYQGHYHRDPRLDLGAAAEVYPDWARRACEGTDAGSAPVLVLLVEDRIAGFAALVHRKPDVIEVTLFAVHPRYQRTGNGLLLLSAIQRHALVSGAKHVLYSTQVENVAARRMLGRCGFLPSYTLLTFHCWI